MKVFEMKHLCDSCIYEFPTCESGKIEFGINFEPETAYTKDADKVITCEGYAEIKNEM